MFDTKKIQQMTSLLEKIPSEFDDVYLIPEKRFYAEELAIFKRLKIPIRGIMSDTTSQKELRGIPFIKTAEASQKFNERTALIILVEKPVSFIQTTFDFKVRGGVWTIPALVMAHDEILAIYDRLTLLRTLQQYREDGLPTPALKDFATRFARGLTTFLDSRYQNVKYQFFDKRDFFKPTYDFDDTAIVIQGPIAYDNNYTVETFKLYRSIYPNVPIVVSTWKGEATDVFREECAQNSVVLMENELPEFPGPWHINSQRISSFQGIKYVQENTPAKFVLKCRTDQRINQFDFLGHFKNLLKTFPPNNNRLLGRIIALDYWKLLPFHVRDFLAFGFVSDVLKLYVPSNNFYLDDLIYSYSHANRWEKIKAKIFYLSHIKLNWEFPNEQNAKLKMFNKMISRWIPPEIFIMKTFCQKYIMPIDETKLLETSLVFMRDCLILLDSSVIFFDWFKYENQRYYYDNLNWQSSFNHWLDIYKNFKVDWI